MVRPASTPNDQAATLRNLKVLVVLLVISNILVGVLGVYLLRAVDQHYSKLVGQSVSVLNDMQTSTARAVEAMRSTNPAFFGSPKPGAAATGPTNRTAIEQDRTLRVSLLTRDWLTKETRERVEFSKAGEIFTQLAGQDLDLVAKGDAAAAGQFRDEKLRPAFDRYLAAITKVADVLEADSLKTSDALSQKTGNFSNIVIGVASWPVIVLFGLLLLTAVFVIAMMIAFRGKDLADMP